MGFFSVRAERLEDVTRHVRVHPVDREQGWVDDGQFQYSPYAFLDVANNKLADTIDLRAGFSVDKRVIGWDHRQVCDGKLGQIALIKHAGEAGESYSTAVMVPTKTRLLGRTEGIVVAAAVTAEMSDVPHALQSPADYAFFEEVVSRAVFKIVKGFDALNLTSKE